MTLNLFGKHANTTTFTSGIRPILIMRITYNDLSSPQRQPTRTLRARQRRYIANTRDTVHRNSAIFELVPAVDHILLLWKFRDDISNGSRRTHTPTHPQTDTTENNTAFGTLSLHAPVVKIKVIYNLTQLDEHLSYSVSCQLSASGAPLPLLCPWARLGKTPSLRPSVGLVPSFLSFQLSEVIIFSFSSYRRIGIPCNCKSGICMAILSVRPSVCYTRGLYVPWPFSLSVCLSVPFVGYIKTAW